MECGDLLQRYAETLKHAEFVGCEQGTGQTKLVSTYKVLDNANEQVEDNLVEKYNIGELKFTCCGWDSSSGKNGEILSPELKKINSNYVLEVSMYGNAEKINEKGQIYIELDRNKVDFYVIVKIIEV